MNYEIEKAIEAHKDVKELYLVTCKQYDNCGLLGANWVLYCDEETAKNQIDIAISQARLSNFLADEETVCDSKRRVVVKFVYSNGWLKIVCKIKKVK